MAIGFMKKISPEYVLKSAITDMEQTGLDGLKPYLTADAAETIKRVQRFSDRMEILSDGLELFTGMGLSEMEIYIESSQDSVSLMTAVLYLLEKLPECEWSIWDVSKGSSSASGVLGFKYQDSMEGIVELTMITEDKEWKIDSIKLPRFSKFAVNTN